MSRLLDRIFDRQFIELNNFVAVNRGRYNILGLLIRNPFEIIKNRQMARQPTALGEIHVAPVPLGPEEMDTRAEPTAEGFERMDTRAEPQ